MERIHKFFNRKLRTLIFFITTKCQLKCKHCFYSSELNNPKIKELTLEEIEKIAEKIPTLEYLQLSGGEPFLREDIVEILEIFFKRGIKKAMIPTNGFLTKKIIHQAERMKKKNFIFSIMISIDGFEDVHNEIRGMNCFNNAMETFEGLKKLGIEVGFNVSLSKLNYSTYIDLIKFLKEKTNNIDPILVRAKPEITLSPEEFNKIKSKVEELSFSNLTPFNKTDSGGTYEGTEETKGITVKLVGQYGSVFFMYQTLSEKRTGTWNINATEEQSSTVTGQLVTKSAFQGSGFGFHLNAGSSLTFELGFMGYYQRNYRRESFVPDSGSNDISDEVIAQEIANSIDTKSQILFPYFTLTVGYSF